MVGELGVNHPRFLRQVMLPEIGAAGQERLLAARARVGGDGLAHVVAARYATGAGFAEVEAGAIDVDALAPAHLVTSTPARQVLAGARAALAAMREAIGIGGVVGAAPGGAGARGREAGGT